MNFLGHIAVAIGCGRDSDDELLGCVLPDLVGMAGMSFDKAHLAPGTSRGIECHHAADAAFHAHPTFVSGAAAVRDELAELHVAAGPRRAVGHVGWELLLDGEVGGSERVTDAFRSALTAMSRSTSGLDRGEERPWATFAERLRRSELWRDYQDPSRVGQRLVSILARRPRLALEPSDAGIVADVLRRAQPAVRESARSVVSDVTATVMEGTPRPLS